MADTGIGKGSAEAKTVHAGGKKKKKRPGGGGGKYGG